MGGGSNSGALDLPVWEKVLQSGDSEEQRLWEHVGKLSRKVWNQNECRERSVGQRQTGEAQIVAEYYFNEAKMCYTHFCCEILL